MDNKSLKILAAKIRKHAIEGNYSAASGHPGGSLSLADLLALLYFEVMNVDPKHPKDENRDRLVLSKDTAHRPCRSAPSNIKLCPPFPQKTAGIFLTLCARALCTKRGGYGIIENNV